MIWPDVHGKPACFLSR